VKKIDPKLMEKILKAHKGHKLVEGVSIDARVSFHEKLAVLTSGSLALAVSGAGYAYQKPLKTLSMTHWLLWCLLASAICLWLSLVASILHNFLEVRAKDAESDRAFYESVGEMFQAIIDSEKMIECERTTEDEKEVEFLAQKNRESQPPLVTKVNRFRKFERLLSITASGLFVFGYFPVIIYMVRLALFI
jgi:hypothetical protein